MEGPASPWWQGVGQCVVEGVRGWLGSNGFRMLRGAVLYVWTVLWERGWELKTCWPICDPVAVDRGERGGGEWCFGRPFWGEVWF